MNKQAMPIVIGVTGHRQLREKDLKLLKDAVKEQLLAVSLKCPNSPVKLLCSLAEGADQLCAEVALELNMGLIAALPMEIQEYKKDFCGEALLNFEKLLSLAEKVVVAPRVEECIDPSDRDYFYRQAGIYVATHSHCLLALWDGTPAKENGCGTAEAVDFAINHSFKHHYRCVCFDDGFVIHVNTPRTEDAQDVGIVRFLGNETLFFDGLFKLDEINKGGGNPDVLSIENGKKYHKALKRLAVLGTVLTTAFLLYDEVMLRGMLIALGLTVVIMFAVYKLAEKSKCHEKYIEYRVLAECLRVQSHLDHCGFDYEVANFLDWSRRFDTAWIHNTLQSFSVYRTIDRSEDLVSDWLLDQKNYHERAAVKAQKMQKKNKSIVLTAAILSLVVYFFALVFEYGLSSQIQNAEIIRVIIKIAVGALSAASLFAANYYGKLSLKRVYEDHTRMNSYFTSAIEYVNHFGVSDTFLKELINEELSENSNWCSYEKDNEIDLTL